MMVDKRESDGRSGNEKQQQPESAEGWKDQLFPFNFNFETGATCFPAYKLGTVGATVISQYTKQKAIRMKVQNFRVKNPGRAVRSHDLNSADDPDGNGVNVDQPTTIASPRKTRWDLDLSALMAVGVKRRVKVVIKLLDGLEFFPGFEVTAKTPQDATRLVNLEIKPDSSDGKPQAHFWVLSEGDGTVMEYGFNIGIVALDSEANSTLSLPILVDPSIRARG